MENTTLMLTVRTGISTANPASKTDVVLLCSFIVNIILSFVFNPIVLVILSIQRDINDTSRLLHSVLTWLDIAMGLCWNLWSILWFMFNDPRTCGIVNKFLPYFHRVIALSILGSVSFISWDRYVMITRPLRYPMIVTRYRVINALVVSLCVFATACIFYIPLPGLERFANILISNCINQTWPFTTRSWEDMFLSLFLVIPICITLIFMTLTNLALLRVAYRHSRAIAAVATASRSGNQALAPARRSYNKGVTTVVLLTLPFYICWLPWILFLTFQDVFGSLDFLDVFGPAASWIRPVIYIVTTKEARGIIHNNVNKRVNCRE